MRESEREREREKERERDRERGLLIVSALDLEGERGRLCWVRLS